MNFKELIRNDIKNVFLNNTEFAETHTVNGKVMDIMFDDFELLDRTKYRDEIKVNGLCTKKGLIYVKAADYGRLPLCNKKITIDGMFFEVEDAHDECGMYSIEIRAVKS